MDSESSFRVDSLNFLYRGKVRDIYVINDEKLLIVQTDRLSAFDVILPDPIPGKGKLLTELSIFWFQKLAHVIPNHWLDECPSNYLTDDEFSRLKGRCMIVKRLKPLPVEAIVRGYLAGSGWKDYQTTGAICGVKLPPGLVEADKLPTPIFSPSTKANVGSHDENISFEMVVELIGLDYAEEVRESAMQLYSEAAIHALDRGIIIADTKFEFGVDQAGKVYLIDEALTSDSSRFWPLEQYRTGTSPPSFDKQFVRDWLESVSWDKRPPAPSLSPDIAEKTSQKYQEALNLLKFSSL